MLCEIPAVFAVENTYQIAVQSKEKAVMWVKVGNRCFFDHSNGVLKSDTNIHKIVVPAKLLEDSGSYTVCRRNMLDRKPYFSETSEIIEKSYDFFPVKGEKIRAYHIADAHNMVDEPVNAAKAYGKIDFLILNGDIPNDSGSVENFNTVYEICARITNGNIPVVFARGNHDLRGICAEKFEEYTPSYNGKSYYTVKLGGFWGVVFDCGEDKHDSNPEYGNTICCRAFREEETDFIKTVAKENKYSDDEIFCRAAICHIPFTQKFEPPFDIEDDIYGEWTEILNECIKPDIMLCGHTHKIKISRPGEDYRNQKFTVAVASEIEYNKYFAGMGIEFSKGGKIRMTVTDSDGKIVKNYDL